MNPFGFVIILIGGVLGYIGYKMVSGQGGFSPVGPTGPKQPVSGTNPGGTIKTSSQAVGAAAASTTAPGLLGPLGLLYDISGAHTAWLRFLQGPTVTPGGEAPASPGATETIGGHTYKPVPGNSPSGYVWQQAS